jgi:type I site-specific restriction endonuclease
MKATTSSLTEFFGEPIDVYTLEQALEDGILIKVGLLQPGNIPVIFTSNLFSEVKDTYKEIIDKGLKMLSEKDGEDTEYMKLRVIEKNKIWVVANLERVTFMKPEDY